MIIILLKLIKFNERKKGKNLIFVGGVWFKEEKVCCFFEWELYLNR